MAKTKAENMEWTCIFNPQVNSFKDQMSVKVFKLPKTSLDQIW
jgi:hypothetical protein